MTATRALVSIATIVSAAVVAGAAGCGGGSRPHIASFTASPAALPRGGGPVMFHWSVSHGSRFTIDPFVGAVTGTATTFVVTTGATFTLTAHGSDGSDRAQATVTVGAPITVTGTVFDPARGNVQHASVFVLGQPDVVPAITSSNGNFVLDGVVAPYDLVIASTIQPVAFEYRGVTRPDPFVSLPDNPLALPSPPQITYSASASGSITGTLFPLAPGEILIGEGSAPRTPSSNVPVDPTAGTWTCASTWIGPATIPQECAFLDGHLVVGSPEYLFGSRTESLANADAKTGESVTLLTLPSSPVSGTVTNAGGTPVVPIPIVRLAPLASFQDPAGLGTYANSLLSTTNSTFSWDVPQLPIGASYAYAQAAGPLGIAREAFRLEAGARSLTLPLPPVQQLPLFGSQIDASSRFVRDLPPDVVGVDVLEFSGGLLVVMSSEPQFTLDGVGANELGLAPPATSTVFWSSYASGMFASMDVALDPAGPTGDVYLGQGSSRSLLLVP